jgi:hypothetical protein
MVEIPKELFTPQSMLTLAGATGAVYAACNALQAAFNFNPRWLGFVLAEVIAETGAYATGGSGLDYVIGFFNGCLIFTSAAGAVAITGQRNTAASPPGSPPPDRRHGVAPSRPSRRSFFSPWF